jgi:hypothetical protein
MIVDISGGYMLPGGWRRKKLLVFKLGKQRPFIETYIGKQALGLPP